MKLKPETLLLVAAEFAVAAVGGYGLRQGINRANQSLERSAAADERRADVSERSHPRLPRPSLLHRADLKPIPAPDPEPCGENYVCGGDQISKAPNCKTTNDGCNTTTCCDGLCSTTAMYCGPKAVER